MGGEKLSKIKKSGRPTDNPKPNKLTVRVDDEAIKILDKYCKRNNVSRANGVRKAIKNLKENNI